MISTISIIIPTLNEEQNLTKLRFLSDHVNEVIVVDGGSTDASQEVATNNGWKLFFTDRGRGAQLNLGAAKATSTLLLFLHADTRLPPLFSDLITECLADKSVILGAFSLGISPSSPSTNLIASGANIRSTYLHLPYGDQALFLRKSDFETLGGFPELPIMEDYIFVRRAKRKGTIRTLPERVTTSARRWQKTGVVRTTLINQIMLIGYHLGVSIETLASFYRRR